MKCAAVAHVVRGKYGPAANRPIKAFVSKNFLLSSGDFPFNASSTSSLDWGKVVSAACPSSLYLSLSPSSPNSTSLIPSAPINPVSPIFHSWTFPLVATISFESSSLHFATTIS